MAGSNNIPKYALWNREDELLEFKVRGVSWSQVGGVQVTASNPLTSALMTQPFYFGASTPTSITGPTEADLLSTFFGQNYLTTVGSTAQTTIQNTSVNPITVTFPGVGSVIVPANSYYTLGFVVSSPGQLSFYQPSTTATGGADPFPLLGNGFVVKTGPGNYQVNTLAGTSPIVVTNGTGASGTTTTISFNGAAATGILASNVVVSPTVAGANNVQSALTAINNSVPVIPSGTGYVVQNPAGTYVVEPLIAGQNIVLTNPDGAAPGTTIAFSPIGSSATVGGPQYSIDFVNAQPSWTTQCQMLASPGTTWRQGAALTNTQFGFVPRLQTNTIVAAPTALTDGYDLNGRCIQSYLRSFGTPMATAKWQVYHFNGENVAANIQTTLAGIHTTAVTGTVAANVSTFTARAYSYVVANTNNIAGLNNYNTALTTANAFYELFSVTTAGNVNGQNFNGLAFNVVSTRDAKKNIQGIASFLETEALETVDKLAPVAYQYKHEEESAPKRLGLIVEEVAEEGLSFLLNRDEGEEKPSKIKIDQIPFLLIQAVKELKSRIEDLEEELEILKRQ